MHDLIDRKAAIDILDAYQVMLENGEENPYSWARFRMSELPSAQPEKCEECGNFNKARLLIPQPERTDCTDCEEYDHDRHFCPKFCDVIKQTVEEVKQERTGRWVRNFDGNEWYWFCSNCKEEWYEEDLLMGGNDFPNFCPNCGARMEGEG